MKFQPKHLFSLSAIALAFNVSAQEVWTASEAFDNSQQAKVAASASSAQYFRANVSSLEKILMQAKPEFTIEVPAPDGKMITVTLIEASIMEPGLAKKFPNIKTFKAQDQSGKHIGRFSFSSKGLHGMFKYNEKWSYIDPLFVNQNDKYTVYYRENALPLNKAFTDRVIDFNRTFDPNAYKRKEVQKTGDTLRTYRLAVSATGEYTQYHGGTVEDGLNAIVAMTNRVNEIYETELAVSFTLIENSEQLIFTDGEADPFANDSGSGELDINQTTIDNAVGSDAYDIGHLVGTGGGGIASLGSVCNATRKAKGLTGLGNPVGDAFYVDFVAHEIGHQFSGNHSFNGLDGNCGTRNAATAFEPGSGSTIMGYAGICASENLQRNSDPTFHIGSINEMRAFIDNPQGGSSCGTATSLSNQGPVANAGEDYTIPANTPFKLAGSATDADGDSLTYMWEQYDPDGSPSSSPETQVDNGYRPLFRSWVPESTGERYFPRLEDVLDGETVIGENYPRTSRDLNFRFVARDGKGGVANDAMVVTTVKNAYGFSIRQPNTDASWFANTASLLSWNTGGSESAPISCSHVNLEVSTDSGQTFEVLESNIVNDGLHTLTAPATPSTTYRLKLSCADSIFFTIPSSDFTVVSSSDAPTDTDGDGMSDEFETQYNLANSAASADDDNDGLSNLEEFLLGTNPTSADSDGDGMPDKFEVDNNFNPNDAADAEADADGDGTSNLQEYLDQTDPNDSASNANISSESYSFETETGHDKWNLGTSGAWTRTEEHASDGTFSVVSSNTTDSSSSQVTLTDVFASGVVSFDRKVSTEEGWDYLEFHIDGDKVGQWSGEQDWATESFNIEQGAHVLKWIYVKDSAVSEGSDQAWVDNVSVPVNPNNTNANATTQTFEFESETDIETWDTSDSNTWSLNTTEVYEGSSSLGAATITHNQSARISYTGNFVSGFVSFYLKVSSEAGYDFLVVYLDGVQMGSWSGEEGWVQAQIPVTNGQQTITWAYEKDGSVSEGSDTAWIDNVSFPVEGQPTEPEPTPSFVAFDYDGDKKADIAVRRPSTFLQYILNSSDSEIQRVTFGRDANDIPVSGDFDGDKKADVAVRRASNQTWYILNSSDGEIQRVNFGKQAEDIPVPADYDGDGITDIAVRRPSNQMWYILNSSDGEIQRVKFGLQSEDIPVPADYDGDGKADIAVRRPSNQMWYILNSSDGEIQRINFGLQSEDIPVPADYDGDGKADVAVRRPSNQMWYIRNSSDSEIQRINFGKQAEDIPIPADYDGDGKADVAVRRPSTQLQYILRSSDGEIVRTQFGRQSTDIPIAGPVTTRMSMAESN